MKMRTRVLAAVVGFLGFLAAGKASAQEFNCASQNMRRNYCSIPEPRSRVELVKQNSDNPCVRGETWDRMARPGGIPEDARRNDRGTARAFIEIQISAVTISAKRAERKVDGSN
jgi:hypothetical protein